MEFPPADFTINQAPFLSNNSLLSLMAEVMPVALTVNNTCASVSNIIITNSGSLRFLHISNVPFSVANAVLPAHNGAGAANKKRDEVVEAELWARGIRDHRCVPQRRRRHPARAARVPRFPGLHRICRTYRDFADDALIDLVFVDFIETQLIGIPSGLQSENVYTTADVAKYTSLPASEALGIYAEQVWN
ncbi:hypothetical protein B0H14DRAFT_3532387 [Mycena olivaceomarginata]|nr:hypothetical protein B0H14DRAFT_3532387 [Mycena olivaceomarginata]